MGEVTIDERCVACDCELRLVPTEDGAEVELTCDCGALSALAA